MEKLVRKKKILIVKDKIPSIMEKFGCCQSMVYNALAYRSNSRKAKEIRKEALNRGGQKVSFALFGEE